MMEIRIHVCGYHLFIQTALEVANLRIANKMAASILPTQLHYGRWRNADLEVHRLAKQVDGPIFKMIMREIRQTARQNHG